jgi:hypothetical protein
MSIAAYLTAMGWVDEPVHAAGHLRQGVVRRCKLLPRQFVLAVSQTRVVAFKAWGDGYAIGIKPGIRASFPRRDVELVELSAGSASRGLTMRVGDELFRVKRPKIDGDWDTDDLISLLGGLPPMRVPREPAWAAFSL